MTNFNRYFAALCLLLTVSFLSCAKKGGEPYPERVLLIYAGVDNNLSEFASEKLEGLHRGWSGRPTDHIIAYVDTPNGATLYYLSVAKDADFEVLSTYGKENSASPIIFTRVISDIKTRYPSADSYGLLVFSHASGWLPEGALTNPNKANYSRTKTRSVIEDNNREMDLIDFATAIPDHIFDYIVFEMCFMAGIEVAYELRNKAPYILASSAEIIHPGFAPVYPTSTSKLIAGNIRGFGKDMFDNIQLYAEGDILRSVTLSVIQTGEIESLAAFVSDNCNFDREVAVGEIQHFDRYNYRLFFDFEEYYSRLLDTEEQRSELSRLIRNCIPWEAHTSEFFAQRPDYNGFAILKHSGLTTYIPQPQFAGLNMAYAKLQWSAVRR